MNKLSKQIWAIGTSSFVALAVLGGSGTPVQATTTACTPLSSTSAGVVTLKFKSTGSCQWTPPAGVIKVDVVAVGGGGGGGASLNDPSGGGTILAGGGGGGGVVTVSTDFAVSAPITVVVGAGGSGTQSSTSFIQSSLPGESSSFDTISAAGGYSPALIDSNNGDKGNGGKSGSNSGGLGAYYIDMGTVMISIGGGGAGAGGAGGAAQLSIPTVDGQGGAGGAGFNPTSGLFSANTVFYGGGGGGGVNFGLDRGSGVDGGGNGASSIQGNATAPTAGGTNTGGGGGGGGVKSITSSNRVPIDGADGGSGIVIVKYLVPATTPSAPTALSATSGDGDATISFTAGANGGAAISNYEYSTDGSTWIALSPADTTSPVTIPGLTNGTAYSIYLRSVNSVGSGTASGAVSVTPAATASAPTSLSATAGDGSASISFTAGANGGAAISNYEYSTDGSTWIALSPADTTSPVTIPGLTNGTAYSIYLRSVNSVGSGTASGAVSVTPAASNSGGGGSGSGSTIAPVIPGSNPAIPSSGVQLGQWVYLLDGVKKSLIVEPNAHVNATGLDISGASFTMSLQGQGSDGKPLGVTSDGALILQQDRIAAVEGTGFKPNTEVEIYVFSTPRYLGSVHTDARGNFKGTVPIPQNLVPGRHTLQSNGFSSTGAIRSLSIGVLLSSQKNSVKTKTIHFSSMSWKLTSRSKANLRALAKTYKSNAVKITVKGNVQHFGSNRNNRSLSKKRAIAIVKYLRRQGVNVTYVTSGTTKAKNKRSSARNAVVRIEYVKY